LAAAGGLERQRPRSASTEEKSATAEDDLSGGGRRSNFNAKAKKMKRNFCSYLCSKLAVVEG
jgi:hypothetical protein